MKLILNLQMEAQNELKAKKKKNCCHKNAKESDVV